MDALTRLAERRILAAVAEGKLSHLPGEGAPLPSHPEEAWIDPLEAVGFRLMHEAGFVPQELELARQMSEVKDAIVATYDHDERTALMKTYAALEMRRNMARETRLRFMHLD